ncbi:MAG: hypothetical protein MUF71_01140 [Candidatus Kapabacteria bacterium]|nr:hypothetical protein [Candidatus Kapabacteria bacterium]
MYSKKTVLLFFVLLVIGANTLSLAQTLQVSTVAFGNIPLRDTSEQTIILRNLSSDSITIQNIVLTNTAHFSLVNRQTNVRLASQQTIAVRCRFIPLALGNHQTSMSIDFLQGQMQQNRTIVNALSGRGVALKIIPPLNLDTFQTGSRRFLSVKLTNTSFERITVNQISVFESTGTIRLHPSNSGFTTSNIVLDGQASEFFTLLIERTSLEPLPQPLNITAQIRVYSTDTSTAEFTVVFVNRPPRFEVEIEPGIRFDPDIANPGDTVAVEIYLSDLYPASLDSLFRIAEPYFSLQFSMNGNLAQSLTSGIRPLGTQFIKGRRTFQIGESRWLGRSTVLFRGAMKVMAGDSDMTVATIDNFQWGDPVTRTVFAVTSKSGMLRVRTCDVGGKRLFTQAPKTALRTIKAGNHDAGEYSERVDISGLPTGTYFVRLQGQNEVRQKAVSVVR